MEKKYLVLNSSNGGWGGPLRIPIEPNKRILSMTGKGIDPLAKHIGKLTNIKVVDGFKDHVPDDEVLLAIINCGGTLRCGVYPQKGIFTVNLNPIGPAGPLAEYIKEDIYVSGVSKDSVTIESAEGVTEQVATEQKTVTTEPEKTSEQVDSETDSEEVKEHWFIRITTSLGSKVGNIISLAYQAGRNSVDIVIKTILPFMVFISVLVALIMASGIGDYIAETLSPVAGSLPGLLLISVICGIPFLSPLLGPGAAIAQVVGVVLGTQIAVGAIPVQYALPALFAINVQVGADFVPVGLSMQQAKPDTIKYGTPAFLLSRQITGPIAVIIAFLFSIGLY